MQPTRKLAADLPRYENWKMMIRLKFYFFRNYWWILTVLFICVCEVVVIIQSSYDFKLLATLLGTLLTLLYFLQKQRLEEMRLFREIFAECNERYDKMNELLNSIVDGPEDESLRTEERMLLNDYFNLCGEEYLYYTQGYIYPSV